MALAIKKAGMESLRSPHSWALFGLTALRNMLHFLDDQVLQTQRPREVLRKWQYQRNSGKPHKKAENAASRFGYCSFNR